MRGIKEQVAKAKRAVDADIAIKRNRYIDLSAPNKKVNYALAAKHRALAGIRGYETDLTALPAQEVIGHYRSRLFNIEQSFRMSKSDLKARPIYARKQDSITAHLNIVMAALAVAHLMETRSDQSIKRLVRTLKKYRSFQVVVGGEPIHAPVPLPPDLTTTIQAITGHELPH
nr:transposase [Corynebacterium intestinale]